MKDGRIFSVQKGVRGVPAGTTLLSQTPDTCRQKGERTRNYSGTA